MSGLLGDVTKLDSSNAVIYIGLGLTALIYVLVIRPMMRRKADPLERAPSYASAAQQRATERQMQSLLVDLSEMARQVSAQLDTRAAKLETLIQQADQRLAALQAAQPPTPTFAAVTRVTAAPAEPPAMIDAEPAALPPPVELDPTHAEIYLLADEGWAAQEIAGRTDRPRGEVELILALRGK